LSPSHQIVFFHIDEKELKAYRGDMNLSLTQEQEQHLEHLINSGRFTSLKQFIDYSLQAIDLEEALVKDDAYNDYLRGLLKESQVAKAQGRVVAIAEGKLASELERRRESRQKSSLNG
jgi:Arc/MetJ-type ribon-helix-helix transcriptional regulator